VIFWRQRLPHAEGHKELLSHLLLAKGDGSTGHHDTFSALQMAFCDLLKNSLRNKIRFLFEVKSQVKRSDLQQQAHIDEAHKVMENPSLQLQCLFQSIQSKTNKCNFFKFIYGTIRGLT
jgi:hypothetical protein